MYCSEIKRKGLAGKTLISTKETLNLAFCQRRIANRNQNAVPVQPERSPVFDLCAIEQSRSMVHSMQLGILIALVFQNTVTVLLMKFTLKPDNAEYDIATVVATIESVKFTTCILLISCRTSGFQLSSFFAQTWRQPKLGIPAVLYAVQNNLVYIAVKNLTTTSYVVCSQSKIIATAVFSVLLLSKKLHKYQYVSFVMLGCGMVLVQVDSANDKSMFEDHLIGFVSVFFASLSSGYAGVFLEIIYKHGETNIFERNAQLSLFSLPLTFLLAWYSQWHKADIDIFNGFNVYVFALIANQAAGGMIIAGVMKYASAILKCFAVSVSVCLCTLVSIWSGDDTAGWEKVLGVLMVIVATFLYSQTQRSNQNQIVMKNAAKQADV